jgi:hypothetical protein
MSVSEVEEEIGGLIAEERVAVGHKALWGPDVPEGGMHEAGEVENPVAGQGVSGLGVGEAILDDVAHQSDLFSVAEGVALQLFVHRMVQCGVVLHLSDEGGIELLPVSFLVAITTTPRRPFTECG